MSVRSVLVLTGPPGSGKSTVAHILTESAASPTVHLHTDDFYAAIKSGFVPPYLPEAQRQNEVVVGVLAQAAIGYAQGGYDVIADGIVGPWFLELFRIAAAANRIDLHYAVLRPGVTVSLARAQARVSHALKDEEVIHGLSKAFAHLGELESHCIDSAALTAAETASTIRDGWEAGRFRLA
jgi:chloramphenicol 3-O-phosphotransferase